MLYLSQWVWYGGHNNQLYGAKQQYQQGDWQKLHTVSHWPVTDFTAINIEQLFKKVMSAA